MPNTSEKVAKRLLDHCLSEWKRHAVKMQHKTPGIATARIRSGIKWYMPLVHFRARAYFDYWDSMDLAQSWDSITAHERGEWIITQLDGCRDCPDCIQDALAYFEIAQGSTYGEVVAELAQDIERSYTHKGVFLERSA